MSRNKKTFNLSREVKEAMEAAYKSARKIKSKDISLDNFLFNLLVPILEEKKECHDMFKIFKIFCFNTIVILSGH